MNFFLLMGAQNTATNGHSESEQLKIQSNDYINFIFQILQENED